MRVRCFTWNIDRPEKVSRETVPPCFAPMFHVEQFRHLFHAFVSHETKVPSLRMAPQSVDKVCFHAKTAVARQRAFKSVCCANACARRPLSSKIFNERNRGRAPRFGYFKREKVSAWDLSDVRVLRSQNTDCRKNDSFSTVSSHPRGWLLRFAFFERAETGRTIKAVYSAPCFAAFLRFR